MLRRISFAAVALVALFFLQFSDCLTPLFAGQESMECCGSPPCSPQQGTHECCKVMASAQPLIVLPVKRTALAMPHVATGASLPQLEACVFKSPGPSRLEPRLASPPEFYTLHSSLLI